MKKVLLLGDSIRVSYQERVKELLSDIAEVVYPAHNSGYSASTLWYIREQAERYNNWTDLDLVHWNNGIWDACDLFDDGPFTTKEAYVADMCRIAGILQKKAKKVMYFAKAY